MMRARAGRRLNLGKTLFLLPNLITLSSIFCGFDALRLAARGTEPDLYRAAILLVFAMVFDTLDGRVARMTRTQSAFGVQIDSLADVVSFGAAPGLIVYQLTAPHHEVPALLAAFVFVGCGAIRLARFNVLTMGERGAPQKAGRYIVGLPIPGAAGILISLVLANHASDNRLAGAAWSWPILALTLGLSMLMVSTVRFRSFKDLKLNAKTVAFFALAAGSSGVIGTQLKPAFALMWLLGFYVILGVIEALWRFPKRQQHARDSIPPGP